MDEKGQVQQLLFLLSDIKQEFFDFGHGGLDEQNVFDFILLSFDGHKHVVHGSMGLQRYFVLINIEVGSTLYLSEDLGLVD